MNYEVRNRVELLFKHTDRIAVLVIGKLIPCDDWLVDNVGKLEIYSAIGPQLKGAGGWSGQRASVAPSMRIDWN